MALFTIQLTRRIRVVLVFLLSLIIAGNCFAQEPANWYNTDSLLQRLATNKKYKALLKDAAIIYAKANIDSSAISLQAFEVAYLEKKLIDNKQVKMKGLRYYKNRRILAVVDYTRPGNKKRMATIDLVRRKLLHDDLVTRGAGTGNKKNDKYTLPVFFSNALGSESSSLGMVLTTAGTHPDNPCHLCRYLLLRRHDDVVVLDGLEKGINDRLKERDVVIHTTGSLNYGTDSLRRLLKIKDTLYRMLPDSCKCFVSKEDGSVKCVSAYATDCGIADNAGFMGQSNGCLVLPEEDHIEMMDIVKNGSLIFIYSNVINGNTNYFKDSPIIRKMVKLAGVGNKPKPKKEKR